MPDFSQYAGAIIEEAGSDSANSQGTTITANASANTKGSYTQLIASTSHDITGIMVNGGDVSNSSVDILLDVAVGAVSSEQVILSNLYFSSGTGSVSYNDPYVFPIFIPAGSRIAVRSQSSTGSEPITINVHLFSHGIKAISPLSIVTTIGDDTSDSGGTSIDSGGSANTKGSYTELITSTSHDIYKLVVCIGNQANTQRASYTWLVDIAIGAAASEQIVIPDLQLFCSSSADTIFPRTFQFDCFIPAGSRIAARSQCSGTNVTDRLVDIILYGVH